MDGRLLGEEVIGGFSEGIGDDQSVIDGPSVGIELGWLLGMLDGEGELCSDGEEEGWLLVPEEGTEEGMRDGGGEGCADTLGVSLGCNVGQWEEEGLSEG